MMLVAVDKILRIGCVETIDDLPNPWRPINGQWLGVGAGRPAQGCHLSQTINMVRVEMSEENTLYVARGKIHAPEVS